MNAIKKILKLILGVVVLLLVVSFFLPSKVHVERKALIHAKPGTVFKLISNLPDWEKWSPWHRIDPNMKLEYGEIKEGKDATYKWTSDHSKVGNGAIKIQEANPVSYIKTEMNFMENGIAHAEYFLEPKDDGTEVRWTMDSDMGWNPIGRYFGLLMDKMIGPDYERGLHYLDSVAQMVKVEEFTMQLEMGKRPGIKAIVMRASGSENAIGQILGEIYGKVSGELAVQKLDVAGAPMALYEDPQDGIFKFEAGMPVDKKPSKPLPANMYYIELPEQEAAIAHFSGPYDKTMEAYKALENFMAEKGKGPGGKPMESYVSDPAEAKTPLDIKTDIIWPVK
jgi:effector-binding domain-containing protein